MTKSPEVKFHKEKCLYRISEDGFNAHGNGKMPEDNPYNYPSQEHDAWHDGYLTADIIESGDSG